MNEDLEHKDINAFSFYMDLVVLYHVTGNPLQVLRDYNFYDIVWPIRTTRYKDAYHEVGEQMRIVAAAHDNHSKADSLVHLAQRLQERDTLASRTGLFWLESALNTSAIFNTNPEFVRRRGRNPEEIEATLEARTKIASLQYQRAA